MSITSKLHQWFKPKNQFNRNRSILQRLHIDVTLLLCLLALMFYGFIILYSAGSQQLSLVKSQAAHIAVASILMFVLAQIHPTTYKRWSPIIFSIGLFLLIAVLLIGHINKGAQRWLGVGFLRFQPSELLKIAIPMMLSYLLAGNVLPPKLKHVGLCFIVIGIPTMLTIIQPDLGTGIILAAAGLSVLFLAGMRWQIFWIGASIGAVCTPILWYFMHSYQRARVLTFLNPERDPLGAGYHIIQSKIAIGSGGVLGKGWFQGTQSHLNFLPEHSTDFVFALCGEEFGLIGGVILLILYMAIIVRGFYITINGQDSYSRLLAGGLTLTFFFSFFINLGMVTGILPVVGVPLPLISYGGSSLVTLMASFGILMSIQTHKRVIPI